MVVGSEPDGGDAMTEKISLPTLSGKFSGDIDQHPDHCPMCHAKVLPLPVAANDIGLAYNIALEIAYVCPNSKCNEMFIAYFEGPSSVHDDRQYRFIRVRPVNPVPSYFAQPIRDISPAFCSITEEANRAQQLGLTEVCGVGYRKALEFLIKDYLIKKFPNDAQAIKFKLLGACIEEYVGDANIKVVAKRAAWLGNDETHYERRWKDKDLNDLRTMINLVQHWIQAEHLTKEALNSMPERRS
jgi:hypothetical protein